MYFILIICKLYENTRKKVNNFKNKEASNLITEENSINKTLNINIIKVFINIQYLPGPAATVLAITKPTKQCVNISCDATTENPKLRVLNNSETAEHSIL